MADAPVAKPDELDAMLEDLELRMHRLKILYEQYFMGNEKAEPTVARKEVVRIMSVIQHANLRNTGMRFKFNNLKLRWSTYTTKWGRTVREIEAGTYVRHIAKLKRRGIEVPAELAAKSSVKAAMHSAVGSAPEEPDVLRPDQFTPAEGIKAPFAPPPSPASRRPPPIPKHAGNPLGGLLDEFNDGTSSFVFETLGPRVGGMPTPGAVPAVAPPAGARPPPIPGGRPTSATPRPLATVPGVPPPPPPGGRPSPPFAPEPARATPATPPPIPGGAARPSTPSPMHTPAPVPGPPRRTLTTPGTPAVSPIPGMSVADLRQLHERFQSQKGASVSYETLVGSLQKQVPDLQKRYNCREVSFEVDSKDGKVVLKAKPKK